MAPPSARPFLSRAQPSGAGAGREACHESPRRRKKEKKRSGKVVLEPSDLKAREKNLNARRK